MGRRRLRCPHPPPWTTLPGVSDTQQQWWVYVLVSESDGQTYVGVTVDLERRVNQHNGVIPGGAKRTARGRPWRLAKTHGPFADRSQAQSEEHAIKRLKGSQRLA